MFEYAREEARALGASELAPVHVVLGILRNGDQRAAAALTASGLELEDARRAARGEEGAVGNGVAGKVDIRAMLARDGALRPQARAEAGRGRAPAAQRARAATTTVPAGCSSGSASRPTACWPSSTPRRQDDADCLEA